MGEPVTLESAAKTGGEVARETWTIVVTVGGAETFRRNLHLVRGEALPGRGPTRSPSEEFALLRAAHSAGVCVQRPLLLCEDGGVLGAPFHVSACAPATEDRAARSRGDGAGNPGHSRPAEGEPGPPEHGRWLQGPKLAAQLGRELAKLHRITPSHDGLGFLGRAPEDLPAARIQGFRRRLDAIGDPRPVLEWTMRWLECNAPDSTGTALCHGAPSPGCCLVDESNLIAILDWYESRWGDPCEDIGAFRAACRRLMAGRPGGGDAAARDGVLEGYREVSGVDSDEDVMRYWEVMSTLGRAVSAIEQGHRFVAGGERSIELALTGRRVAELEIELLAETDRLAMEGAHA